MEKTPKMALKIKILKFSLMIPAKDMPKAIWANFEEIWSKTAKTHGKAIFQNPNEFPGLKWWNATNSLLK